MCIDMCIGVCIALLGSNFARNPKVDIVGQTSVQPQWVSYTEVRVVLGARDDPPAEAEAAAAVISLQTASGLVGTI